MQEFLWPRVYRSPAEIAAEEAAAVHRAQVRPHLHAAILLSTLGGDAQHVACFTQWDLMTGPSKPSPESPSCAWRLQLMKEAAEAQRQQAAEASAAGPTTRGAAQAAVAGDHGTSKVWSVLQGLVRQLLTLSSSVKL